MNYIQTIQQHNTFGDVMEIDKFNEDGLRCKSLQNIEMPDFTNIPHHDLTREDILMMIQQHEIGKSTDTFYLHMIELLNSINK